MELVLVLALAGLVMGSFVITFGTLVRHRPQVHSVVNIPLTSGRLNTFYNSSDVNRRNTHTAPSFGSLAEAEKLREQFYHDVLSATAVFCLYRAADNTYKPAYIPFNPETDEELDTPQKFRAHLIKVAGISASLYDDFRNPGAANKIPQANASIFILGYTSVPGRLRVNALYDIDIIRLTDTTAPMGFHASVKRYADPNPLPQNTAYSLVFSAGYRVYYPPSNPNATSATQFTSDNFSPLFVTFERYSRRSLVEGVMVDRFKMAAERPFYFIWWPDPAAPHFGPQPNTANPTTPQHAYNHMAGRTSFMFTVPMFPAL